jgi:hypothetical protein
MSAKRTYTGRVRPSARTRGRGGSGKGATHKGNYSSQLIGRNQRAESAGCWGRFGGRAGFTWAAGGGRGRRGRSGDSIYLPRLGGGGGYGVPRGGRSGGQAGDGRQFGGPVGWAGGGDRLKRPTQAVAPGVGDGVMSHLRPQDRRARPTARNGGTPGWERPGGRQILGYARGGCLSQQAAWRPLDACASQAQRHFAPVWIEASDTDASFSPPSDEQPSGIKQNRRRAMEDSTGSGPLVGGGLQWLVGRGAGQQFLGGHLGELPWASRDPHRGDPGRGRASRFRPAPRLVVSPAVAGAFRHLRRPTGLAEAGEPFRPARGAR